MAETTGMNIASDKKQEASIDLRPTLFIGVGGTGMEVLMRVRRRILNTLWGGTGSRTRVESLAEFPVAQFIQFDLDTGAVIESGRAQSDDLQFEVLKFSDEDKVVELIRYSRDHVSLDAPVEEDGDTALGDLIAREVAPGPDEMVLDAEERKVLDDLLENLDERSADVVRRRYGLLDGRQAKLADIGAVWGITAERVRQIERNALAQLRLAA